MTPVTRSLPLLATAALLAACSPPTPGATLPVVGYVGLGDLPFDVLAYTAADATTGNTTYKIQLKWSTVLGAKSYEISRKFGDTAKAVLTSTDKDTYVDTSLAAGQGATYSIRAIGGDSKEIKHSPEIATTVLAQEVAKPTDLTPANDAKLTSIDAPTLKWAAVPTASLYHVKVIKVADQSVVYAAVTKDASIKLGDQAPVTFAAFQDLLPGSNPQGLAAGTVYRWTVQALRTDKGQDPTQIRAIDGNTSAPSNFTLGG